MVREEQMGKAISWRELLGSSADLGHHPWPHLTDPVWFFIMEWFAILCRFEGLQAGRHADWLLGSLSSLVIWVISLAADCPVNSFAAVGRYCVHANS